MFGALSGPIDEAVNGRLYDWLFRRGGNELPKIERVYATSRGQEIEPTVQRGGGIFLRVDAVDPEGDNVDHSWVAVDEGFFSNWGISDPKSEVVYFYPPRRAGVYVVKIRIRDEVHVEWVEQEIKVRVVDPLQRESTIQNAPANALSSSLSAQYPKSGDRVNRQFGESVEFSWTPSTAPYTFTLRRSTGVPILERQGLLASSVEIQMPEDIKFSIEVSNLLWEVIDGENRSIPPVLFSYLTIAPAQGPGASDDSFKARTADREIAN